ncbi:hypothetical protein [Ignavibacterium sp.]|uniref:hypothetical protein n=1 Tax=Ignavibacterium sp. TaxID=2651167 RepID=UPI0025C15D1E|nr:hypothetical protein [Ignavibacterium sp.]
MKKQLIGFLILFAVGLFLAGCQSAGDLTSPVNDLEKKGGNNTLLTITPINTTPGAETCVELVAGQHYVVGTVCIKTEGTNLKVKYNITDSDWSITETHLAVVGDPADFPRTSNGNPKVGNFPYKGTHSNVGEVEYTIPIGNLPSTVYVAAHAVVQNCNSVPTTNLCPDFPSNVSLTPTWLPSGYDYTVKVEFDSQTYFGFCVDNSRYIGSGGARTVNFICSYDPTIPNCTTFVEKPENLDLVNWIINNRQSNWNRATVQAAIWKLINPSGNLTGWDTSTTTTGEWRHDPVLREQIIALAYQYGEGFVPGCDQKVLVLVYGPGEICNPIRQVLAFEVPVECVPGDCNSETAWGFPYNNGPVPGKSALFGSQWARYFSYLR